MKKNVKTAKRINESQLRAIISKSIKKTLRESQEMDDIDILKNELLNVIKNLKSVMKECGYSYTRPNKIPIDDLNITKETKHGTLIFDTLEIDNDTIYLFDYKNYMNSLYHPLYGQTPQDDWEYDEFGPQQEGMGCSIERMDESSIKTIINGLKKRIEKYKSEIPGIIKQQKGKKHLNYGTMGFLS